MDYKAYIQLFEEIVSNKHLQPPYDNPKYLDYTKLNFSRMNRWQKTLQLDEALVNELNKISAPQQWIVIVEPWCGDAAPTVPFIVRLAAQHPLIGYDLQLRDTAPFLINTYLTNGTKSIPKLIVRDAAGNDLFTWGPRPKPAQQLVNGLKAANVVYDTISTQLQSWYNKDKGVALQQELLQLFKEAPHQLV